MSSHFFYRCFELGIRSEIPLPEINGVSDGEAHIEIARGTVPHHLPEAAKTGICYQATKDRLLLKFDGIARYLIEDGRRILVQADPSAHDADVRVFLLGSALGAALHQRGDLVLHGSAIGGRGEGIGFLGVSGIGKSTLAMAFQRRGYGVFTDDLCVLRSSSGRPWFFQPGIPQTKLWMDALDQLSISAEGLPRVRNKLEKRFVPVQRIPPTDATHFYILRISEDRDLRLERLSGPRKLAALRDNTYRPQFVAGMGGTRRHFEQVMSLARQAEVTEVWRPAQDFRLEELVNLLEEDFLA